MRGFEIEFHYQCDHDAFIRYCVHTLDYSSLMYCVLCNWFFRFDSTGRSISLAAHPHVSTWLEAPANAASQWWQTSVGGSASRSPAPEVKKPRVLKTNNAPESTVTRRRRKIQDVWENEKQKFTSMPAMSILSLTLNFCPISRSLGTQYSTMLLN